MHKIKLLGSKVTFPQKIMLMALGILLSIFLLEISLRIGGFLVMSLQEYRNHLSMEKEGTYRIMCLGESTTQGQYPRFLEEILNQHNIGIKIVVIDEGIRGTNTTQILNELETNLKKYTPNMVITMMGINDSGDFMPFEQISNSKLVLFVRSFRIYKLVRLLWLHIKTKTKEIGFYKPGNNKKLRKNSLTTELKYANSEINSNQRGESLEKTIDFSSKSDIEYAELGWYSVNRREFSRAEELFKKAIQLNPKNTSALIGLGTNYQAKDEYIKSKEPFKRAIEINPQEDRAYVGLGWYYGVLKVYEAEEAFKKAIKLNPKNDNAYAGLGWCYRTQDKFSEAEDSFKKALELNRGNLCAVQGLGQVYHEKGRLSEAAGLLKEAIKLGNNDKDELYGELSELYEAIGRRKDAEDSREMANKLRNEYYRLSTANNYRKLEEILGKKGIRLVCVQYPTLSVEPLKKLFKENENVLFVDNEKIFKDATRKEGYNAYFRDSFGGDFGHCTNKGNRLLADNIANAALKELFGNKIMPR